MTRREFEELVDECGFNKALNKFMSNTSFDDLTSLDTLLNYVKRQLDERSFYLARHVLNNIDEDYDWYIYDYSMGTLQEPMAITEINDLEEYFD